MGKQLDKAVELHRAGRWAEAEKLYESLYRREVSDPEAAYLLGIVRLSQGRNEAAVQPLRRAARLSPRNLEAHRALGEAFDRLGLPGPAADAYRRAVALRPDDARLQLALGAVLLAGQDAPAALAAFDAALVVEPSLVQAHNNAGLALKQLGRFDEAADRFAAALAVQPSYAAAAFNLGNLLTEQGRMEEAEPWLRKAVLLAPELLNARFTLANVLRETGRHAGAIEVLDEILRLAPDEPAAMVWRCMFELPVLYRDQAEIDASRARYAARLAALAPLVEREPQRFLQGFATTRPFLLAYQGKADRELQALYGGMLEKVVAANVAAGPPPTRRPPTGRKVRLGIVSGYFHRHSVWKIPTRGWLRSLDREAFEVVCYHTSGVVDAETAFARLHSDAFVQGPLSLPQWVERLRQDDCDILLYPEIGMDPMAVQLAALRLAPVQANGLGHPVTSGLATIDVALSSALMEPPDADTDYLERLLRLPNLGAYYEPLETPAVEMARDGVGLSDDDFVFWCPQSLFKYQPRFDNVFARIAAGAPSARFLFIDYRTGRAATAPFIDRLETSFKLAGLDMRAHCRFAPRLSQAEFVAMAALGDAVLDSIEWSGFNSTLESLAHDLPLVSYEGTFMRGRHSAAVLRRLGLPELVAGDIDGYVAIAQRLANDPAYRWEIRSRIAAAKPCLVADRDYAAALNRTLLDLLA